MSAVIAAAVQLSSAGGQPSSLSLGSASILQPFSKLEKKQRRFSLFSWKKPAQTSTSPVSPTTPSTPGLEHSHSLESCISSNAEEEEEDAHTPRNSSSSAVIVDDGRDELVYRGIQIKEIKTTLKPLVISDEVRNPMPQVKLERPGFARINY
ncbi:uncharacterized protein B0P05DRAFT_462702 [Gilbertella persicaria]|uniref:uncharacterized protein n=1 Tax=Gilbertella persicaria TaxID=101096 RepID=UPI0022200EEF|nr:uncharacterized protein B0P05DRAFT_462702 [Gilbertella persicaria]KAI8092359.1 hypothetical protein B0P05DRAFT_462702 [Gilbertella persicaria]